MCKAPVSTSPPPSLPPLDMLEGHYIACQMLVNAPDQWDQVRIGIQLECFDIVGRVRSGLGRLDKFSYRYFMLFLISPRSLPLSWCSSRRTACPNCIYLARG